MLSFLEHPQPKPMKLSICQRKHLPPEPKGSSCGTRGEFDINQTHFSRHRRQCVTSKGLHHAEWPNKFVSKQFHFRFTSKALHHGTSILLLPDPPAPCIRHWPGQSSAPCATCKRYVRQQTRAVPTDVKGANGAPRSVLSCLGHSRHYSRQ